MALLSALLATALLMALSLGTALLGAGEMTLAARDRDARSASYAARAGATLAIAELESRQTFSGVLAPGVPAALSAAPGPFVDATLTPAAPWDGSTIDLRGLTTKVQNESDAASGLGGDAPIWRLFLYGPLSRLIPAAGARSPFYLAVWVSDDRGDGDGSPSADTDGSVLIHAEALGAGQGRAVTEATVVRQAEPNGPDVFRIVSIRVVH